MAFFWPVGWLRWLWPHADGGGTPATTQAPPVTATASLGPFGVSGSSATQSTGGGRFNPAWWQREHKPASVPVAPVAALASVGPVAATGAARTAARAVGASAIVGPVTARGRALAFVVSRRALAGVTGCRARGLHNPTDEELILMLLEAA